VPDSGDIDRPKRKRRKRRRRRSSSGAERQRRHYELFKRKRMVVPVEIEDTLGLTFAEVGLLRTDQTEDRKAIGHVLSHMVLVLDADALERLKAALRYDSTNR
jgi:hypothetical protein